MTFSNRPFRFLSSVFAAALLLSAGVSHGAVGYIEGDLSVKGGAAQYRVPLPVPPGIAGLVPELALEYSSRRDLHDRWGFVGRGWRLGGLSVIHRCGATLAQDGYKGGIRFDASDRFCLNGRRLVAINGVDGANGTEYRTELDTFSKVVSYGAAGNGPASFKVWTKSGKVLELGYTADSRIEAQGKSSVMAWAVNRIADRSGNAIDVSYQEINASSEFVPLSIDYAGNRVEFNYSTVSGSKAVWLGGSKVQTTQLLDSIRTYTGAQQVFDWTLGYETSAATDAPLLNSLRQCDGAGACLPATTFDWQAGAKPSLFGGFQNNSFAPLTPEIPSPDFQGDHIKDTFGYNNGYVYVNGKHWTNASGNLPRLGDVDGDGKTDFVTSTYTKERTWGEGSETITYSGGVYLSTGTTFQNAATMGYEFASLGLGDINGDGRDDLIGVQAGGCGVTLVKALSNGSGFGAFTTFDSIGAYYGGQCRTFDVSLSVGDINGDGLADVLLHPFSTEHYSSESTDQYQHAGKIWISNGESLEYYSTNSCKYCSLSDVNGDGLADMVNGAKVALARATKPDLLNGIHGATTSTLTYKELTDSSVHTLASGTSYPVMPSRTPAPLVATVVTDDGVGGDYQIDYRYGGAKYHDRGRGFLGFEWIEKSDPQTQTLTRTAYSQTFPFIGMPTRVTTRLSDGRNISEVENSYAEQSLNDGKSLFPYLSQTVEKSWQLESSVITQVTKTFAEYGSYGDVGKVTVKTASGSGSEVYTTITHNSYRAANTTDWLVGLLASSTRTDTHADGSAVSRRTDFVYDASTGLVTRKVEAANDPSLSVTSDYAYDRYGNVAGLTLSTPNEASRSSSTSYTADGRFPASTTNALGQVESYTYDARFGLVTSQTGVDGLTTRWSYDGFGRKILEERPDGTQSRWSLAWSCSGTPARGDHCLTEAVDGTAPVTVHYDALGRELRTVTTGFDGSAVYKDTVYNHLGQTAKSSRAYFEGAPVYWATHSYDALGRKLTTVTPGVDGTQAVHSWRYSGRDVTETDAKGRVKITTTNPLGLVTRVLDAAGSAEQSSIAYTYDPRGNLETTTDLDGNRITMGYDIHGNKTSMNDPDMGYWSYVYNGFGELKEQTDANGTRITMAYDALGRMIQRTDHQGGIQSTSRWYYDDRGRLQSMTGPGGYQRQFGYDALGRVVTLDSTLPDGGVDRTLRISNEYDAYSRLKVQYRPGAAGVNGGRFKVENVYDANGYLTAVRSPRGQAAGYEAAHLTALITRAAADADALLDAAVELQAKVDTFAAKADYYRGITQSLSDFAGYTGPTMAKGSYPVYTDASGQRYIKVTDPALSTGKWVLIAGDVIIPVPLGGEHYVRVNANGDGTWSLSDYTTNVAQPDFAKGLTANGQTLHVGNFDGQGGSDFLLLSGGAYLDDVVIDSNLHNTLVSAAQELEAAAEFLAGEANDYIQLADNLLLLAETGYREALKRDLWVENYQGEYGDDYRTLASTDTSTAASDGNFVYLWQARKRDAEGRLARYLSGNGLTTVQNYDPATGHLRHIQTGFANVALVRDLSYQYDPLNNLTSRRDHIQQVEESFTYDGMDRLTQSSVVSLDGSGAATTVNYQYDALGNLTYKSDVGIYSYGDAYGARPHAVTAVDYGDSFTYDANGSLLSGNGRVITWTAFNKPATLSHNGQSVSFAYDPERNRYRKTAGEETTLYLDKLYERVQRGIGTTAVVEHRNMVYADGQLVATQVDTEDSVGNLTDTQARYHHSDPLGSIDTITDGAGNVVERLSFDPFGGRRPGNWQGDAALVNVSDLFSNRGYTGHEHIDEVGLIHMNGRVYDPELGRFLSADPFIQEPYNTQSFNRYSYVMNNPMKFWDPSGFVAEELDSYDFDVESVLGDSFLGSFDETESIGSGGFNLESTFDSLVGSLVGDLFSSYDSESLQSSYLDVAVNVTTDIAKSAWNGFLGAYDIFCDCYDHFAATDFNYGLSVEISSAIGLFSRARSGRGFKDALSDAKGTPPPNLSPVGAGRTGAFKEVKRQSGIPASQQPSNVGPNFDKRGNVQPGRTYEFEVPAPGGGTKTVSIRDDARGHDYGPGDLQNRGPHFNNEAGDHFDY